MLSLRLRGIRGFHGGTRCRWTTFAHLRRRALPRQDSRCLLICVKVSIAATASSETSKGQVLRHHTDDAHGDDLLCKIRMPRSTLGLIV